MDQNELRDLLAACKGTGNLAHVPGGVGGGGVVRFSGRVAITGSEPLPIYPGTTLEGDGPSSLIDATEFEGAHVIEFRENVRDETTRCEKGVVTGLRVEMRAGSGQTAIGVSPWKPPSGRDCIAHECQIRDVEFMGDYGVVAPNFQESTIDGLFSLGAVESIADLGGTVITLRRIRQDGSLIGQSTAPYVRLVNASSARLEGFVLEGVGRAGKPGVALEGGGGIVVDGLRVSPEADGSLDILRLVGCRGVSVRGELRTLSATRRIVVQGSRGVAFEALPNPQSSLPLSAYLDVDSASYVLIRSLETRYAESLYRLDLAGRLRIDDVILAGVADEGVAGYVARDRVHIAPGPGNLFADPGFAQGAALWTHPGSTATAVAGPLGGAALELSGLASGNRDVYQDITIGQELIGSGAMLSLGVLARVIGPGYLVPMPGGLVATVKSYYHRISQAAGWAMAPATVAPVAAGTHHVGWRVYGHDSTTRVLICRPWFGAGPEAWIGGAS